MEKNGVFDSSLAHCVNHSVLIQHKSKSDYGHTKDESLILCSPKFESQSQIKIWDVDIKKTWTRD